MMPTCMHVWPFVIHTAGITASIGWRFPFAVVAIPGILSGVLVLLVPEPTRGAKEHRSPPLQQQQGTGRYADAGHSYGKEHTRVYVGHTKKKSDSACHSNEKKDESSHVHGDETRSKANASCTDGCASVCDTRSDLETRAVYHEMPEAPNTRSVSTCVSAVFTVPCNILIFVQGIFGCISWSALTTYLHDFLAEEGGLTIHNATYVVRGMCACV